MKHHLFWAILITMSLSPALASAAPPATAAATKPYYSTAGSSIGVLLDNAATKAIVEKAIPTVIDNPQITMARPLTLKQLQKFANGKITDADLVKIDAELAKVPAPKG